MRVLTYPFSRYWATVDRGELLVDKILKLPNDPTFLLYFVYRINASFFEVQLCRPRDVVSTLVLVNSDPSERWSELERLIKKRLEG